MLPLVVVLVLSGCGGTKKQSQTLLIAVDAPFSRSPYIGQTIAHGVELAASEINVAGVATNDGTYTLKVKRYDNALSPRKALGNIRRAIADGAVAIVDDGTGVDASWQVARDAHVPICITYDGGAGLVDLAKRPNVFRIAPTTARDRVPPRRVHDPERAEARAHPRRHDVRAARRRRACIRVRAQPGVRDPEAHGSRGRGRSVTGGLARTTLRRDGASGLGPSGDDRKGSDRRTQRELGRADVRAAVGRRIPCCASNWPIVRNGSTA